MFLEPIPIWSQAEGELPQGTTTATEAVAGASAVAPGGEAATVGVAGAASAANPKAKASMPTAKKTPRAPAVTRK